MNLRTDFLESTSPPMIESVWVGKTGSPLPKYKYTQEIPIRYLSIHFTVSQCSFFIFKRIPYTTLITCVIFGLAYTITYIKLLIANVYGVRFISSFPYSLKGHWFEMRLKWPTSGKQTCLVLLMLNFLRTFSM